MDRVISCCWQWKRNARNLLLHLRGPRHRETFIASATPIHALASFAYYYRGDSYAAGRESKAGCVSQEVVNAKKSYAVSSQILVRANAQSQKQAEIYNLNAGRRSFHRADTSRMNHPSEIPVSGWR